MAGEIWAPIVGYPDYSISNLGRIWSARCYGRIVKQTLDPGRGYYYVGLYPAGSRRQKKIKVHRLVADAFVGNPLGFPTVDHIDGDKANNAASNLRWCSFGDNIEFYITQAGHKHKSNFKPWSEPRGWV